MADIVISYKREEKQTARALADALPAEGWTVWWDPKLRTGDNYFRLSLRRFCVTLRRLNEEAS